MSSNSQTTRIHATTPPSLLDERGDNDRPSRWLRRTVMLLPVGIFAGLAVMLGWGLSRNAQVIPSALIGKQVPEFSLPPVQARALGLSSTDLTGEVSLVQWVCILVHGLPGGAPVFMELKRTGAVPIHCINYKDRPKDAEKWLDTMGDPYTRTGADLNGRVSIDWGIYGVRETFVVDRRGQIAFKLVGAVTPEVYRERLAPLLRS